MPRLVYSGLSLIVENEAVTPPSMRKSLPVIHARIFDFRWSIFDRCPAWDERTGD